ncbi:polysaccharide biosynthesis/export family protein [Cecembia calidifontis]|jgi:polysaccharide export outer membrane protein|uniref:Polysaccharide export outer membrane protein n=1 Tax=Cecembia calidifontis TaxID=1187080 RepID=A0A4Q7PBC2_9BACT|nr:polysaccharide biosynthesis/export family protein [Cecembia calidifontis]RZS96978.1 polysaccharide export outer membrane protein [Cecembia calidifontis]
MDKFTLFNSKWQLSLYVVLVLYLSSCSVRNLTYFSDLDYDKIYTTEITNENRVTIQKGDLLRITLSSLQPELNAMFNDPLDVMDYNRTIINNINAEGFIVDEMGQINIPTVGNVKVGGLTKTEAKIIIEQKIGEYIKDPVVSIRFSNFKITVIGEVNNPSTFFVPNEEINILEALGLAGDMTEFGLRESVLLIREKDGKRTVSKINFNSSDLLDSPLFYLKQNDIIYVQPHKLKAVKASTNERNMILVGLAVSIIIPILFNWQNIFQ